MADGTEGLRVPDIMKTTRPSRAPLALFAVLCATLCFDPLCAAPWVTFSEVAYRPQDERLEFVEIYNLEAPHVDLGGWKLDGEIEFEFPRGLRLAPRGCLVVARDVAAFRARYPDAEHVVGPFVGRLDNDGGRVILRNRVGVVAARMRYGRDGAWSAVADGTGYTLVLADPLFDPTAPRSWRPSATRGGSPGMFEASFERVPGDSVVARGASWRFWRGSKEPPANWYASDLDDSDAAGWEGGPSGFGFADNDDATVLGDMAGQYVAVFTRKTFAVDDPAALGELSLLVDFDDGFVAYLNGREIARENVGAVGEPVVWNRPALGNREAGRAQVVPLGLASRQLRAGDNVLAVAAFNNSLQSSDLSLIVELESRKVLDARKASRSATPRLNEIALRRTSSGDRLEWVEIANPTSAAIDLRGWFLSDEVLRPAKWRIAEETNVPPDGFALLHARNLGADRLAETVLFLTAPDGAAIVDALAARIVAPAAATAEATSETAKKVGDDSPALAYGRFPDATGPVRRLAEPTAASANLLFVDSDVVIHEINYHPLGDDPAGEYVELHNRGAKPVPLANLRLDGGARFAFAAGTKIDPGGFLVVARDPAALAAKHGIDAKGIVGPFAGRLANSGETIRLRDASDRSLDEVRWSDRAPWPELADGWGASLELVDASTDNALGAAWAASDASTASEWVDVRYVARVYIFHGMAATSFQFLLHDVGECLIDDFSIVDAAGTVVDAHDFAGDVERWRAFGTHLDSGVLRESPLATSSCYRIVATGRGNSRHNYVSLDLDDALEEDAEYVVSFRARWLRGSSLLLSRTSGQGLARTHRLPLPTRLGTPGRPNSRAATAAPIVGTPTQNPVAPSAEDAVRIDVPVSCGKAVERVELRYRHASNAEWSVVRLQRKSASRIGGVGSWAGTIPALPKGRVEFAVTARSADGREGAFPAGGIERPAQYAVGLVAPTEFPTYTVLVTDREWTASRERQRMSNRCMDATLVYGTSRIFYNVGFRARGSGFTRGGGNWRLVFGAETLDGRAQLTFDGQRPDPTKMNERATFWLLDQVDVPTPRQRYVHVDLYDHSEESGLYEEVEKVDGDYVERWYPRSPNGENLAGRLHKVDDYWDYRPPSAEEVAERIENARRAGGPGGGGPGRRPGGFRGGFPGFGRGNGSYVEAYLLYESTDPEDYRWNFPPRANGAEEDFRPLIDLIRLADPDATDTEAFLARAESVMDVDEWLRVFAARTLANDWDAYGLNRGKNAYLYRGPSGRWCLLPWDSDLSWRGFGGFGGFGLTIFPQKFPAVRRLLEVPKYRRRYLGYVAHLATKRLGDPFAAAVDELEEQVGIRAPGLRDAATSNRDAALRELPKTELRIERVERGERIRVGDSDAEGSHRARVRVRVRVAGTAPIATATLRLAGRAGRCRFPDDTNWSAEFEIPEGSVEGEIQLEAIDRDGDRIDAVAVSVPPRTDEHGGR